MDIAFRHIVLASASPRRLEILRAHGIEPQVIVAKVDETELLASLPSGLLPEELVQQLALLKAESVYEQLQGDAACPDDALILAADTVVCHEKLGMLGKPTDYADAVRMLRALCNTAHKVVTGVALINCATGRRTALADVTTVHFGAYGLKEIEAYLALEPPFDKAGSYAIQGMWGKQVVAVEGDLENVIGLPYYRLSEL